MLVVSAIPLFAQSTPPVDTPHDLSQVDSVPPGATISIPLPPKEQKRLKRYDMPELVGARQALGSQLVDGELPQPLIDFYSRGAALEQRVSIFRSGLAVVSMSGAGGSMLKKLILPADAVAAYRKAASPALLAKIRKGDVTPPSQAQRAFLRLYRDDGSFVELAYDPQTAGGLLISLPADKSMALEAEFAAAGLFLARVGRVEAGSGLQLA